MSANAWKQASRERLVADLDHVLDDVENYLLASAGQAGEAYVAAQAALLDRVRAARSRLEATAATLASQARTAARTTDAYVHRHAWKSIATAATIGFLAGFLITRR